MHKYQVDGRGFNSLELVGFYVGVSPDLASRCSKQMGNCLTSEQILKSRTRAAPVKRAYVTYAGKDVHIDHVAKAEGLTGRQMYDWWKRNGYPSEITENDLKKLREVLNKSTGIYTLLPDGTRHAGRELCKMFGLSHATLSNRKHKTGQTVYTRAELESLANRELVDTSELEQAKPKDNRPRSIHDVEYHPSAMERSMMGLR